MSPRRPARDGAPAVDFASLIDRIAESCPEVRGTTEGDMLKRHREMFERMVDNTDVFLKLMRLHGAVVGGSAVVQIAWPAYGSVSNYDLFVPSRSATALIAYLTTVEGYKLGDIDVHGPHNGCVVADTTYWLGVTAHVTLSKCGRTIDVLAVGAADEWDRVLLPIARSWATIVMNYATADEVCITYPTLTLQGKTLVRWSHALDASFPAGTRMVQLEKYHARGVEFRTHADDWDDHEDGQPRTCDESWVCPVRERAFGDDGCLVVGKGGDEDSRGGVSWMLGGSRCPFNCGDAGDCLTAVHIDWCNCPGRSASM